MQIIRLLLLRFSARSRVRGTLEIYHAFVRDLDASTSSAASDSDWDVIDDEAGTPTSVSIRQNWYYYDVRVNRRT